MGCIEGLWSGWRVVRRGKAFYIDPSACVKVKGDMGEYLKIRTGLRQGHLMSPWLFNVFMDGIVKEVKAKIGNLGVEISIEWKLNTMLFAGNTVLLPES